MSGGLQESESCANIGAQKKKPVGAIVCSMAVSLDSRALALGLEDKPFLKLLLLPSLDEAWQHDTHQEFICAVTGVKFLSDEQTTSPSSRRPKDMKLAVLSEDGWFRIL